jgi:hypothetical protein
LISSFSWILSRGFCVLWNTGSRLLLLLFWCRRRKSFLY